jgi:hypothetical protein
VGALVVGDISASYPRIPDRQTGRMSHPPEVVTLERWTGPVDDSDPHANFKREVAG